MFNTPEVVKVYVGSFNAKNQGADGSQQPWANNPLGAMLFEKEQQDLLNDLYAVPSRSTDRKVNEFVKRVRAARTHMLIVGNLRKQMPQARAEAGETTPPMPPFLSRILYLLMWLVPPRAVAAEPALCAQVFGQDAKQEKLLNRLHEEFEKCQARARLCFLSLFPPHSSPSFRPHSSLTSTRPMIQFAKAVTRTLCDNFHSVPPRFFPAGGVPAAEGGPPERGPVPPDPRVRTRNLRGSAPRTCFPCLQAASRPRSLISCLAPP